LKVTELSKAATQLKSKDPGAAIEKLREAQAIARRFAMNGLGVQWWLRLPLFLQLAGRATDADAEFSRIEDEIKRPAGHFAVADGKLPPHATHSHLAQLYDKWRLACERSGDLDRASTYRLIADREQSLAQSEVARMRRR
jgi:hypothetical protein